MLQTSESHLYPRFDALEEGATPNLADIGVYLRDGIELDFVEDYRRHVPCCLEPLAPRAPPAARSPRAPAAPTSVSAPPVDRVNRAALLPSRSPSPEAPPWPPSAPPPAPPPAAPPGRREPSPLAPGVRGTVPASALSPALMPAYNAFRPRARPPPPPLRSYPVPPHPFGPCPPPVYGYSFEAPFPFARPPLAESLPPRARSPPPPRGGAGAPQRFSTPGGSVVLSVSECEVYSLLSRVDPMAAHCYMAEAINRGRRAAAPASSLNPHAAEFRSGGGPPWPPGFEAP